MNPKLCKWSHYLATRLDSYATVHVFRSIYFCYYPDNALVMWHRSLWTPSGSGPSQSGFYTPGGVQLARLAKKKMCHMADVQRAASCHHSLYRFWEWFWECFVEVRVTIDSESPPAAVKVPISTPVRPRSSASAAPMSAGAGRVYEGFLELPVAFVLGVMWLAGAALVGLCALTFYLVVSALI